MSNAIHSTRFVRVACGLGVAALIAGCASSTPATDATFGDAVRAALLSCQLPGATATR